MSYETIKTEIRGPVALVTLNRPKQLNALNTQVMNDVCDALAQFDGNPKIGAMVVTGSEKAFAAGADVGEMASLNFQDAFAQNLFADWERVRKVRKPIIAAVAGYALGGGCELAMMCDFVIAAENAKFGQPEVTLGTIPGIGGTQRLTRLIGKSKAMDMILTGRMMDAKEAERAGLVARIVPYSDLIEEAVNAAEKIASYSQPVIAIAKEAVNQAEESGLAEGLLFERRVFNATFALSDRQEGMEAFLEKRTPNFKDR